jgi:palmitoyltransferase ZDHHC9/14/18
MAPIMDISTNTDVIKPTIKRIYQIWPGKNRFFLNGRVMLGPAEDSRAFYGTLLVLVVLELLFLLFICPYLWYEVTTMIPLISLQLFILSMFFMLLTIIINPGIIPRKEIFLAMGELPDVFCAEGTEKRKYCRTCQIYKPVRSNHCSRCDNCVEVYDHHCPFVNSCIGKNNYKYFIAMVTSLTLLGGMDMAGLFLFIFYDSDRVRVSRSCKSYIVVENSTLIMSVAVILTFSITLLTIFVFLLCMFHMKISISGETTKEFRLNTKQTHQSTCYNEKSWFHPRLIIHSL